MLPYYKIDKNTVGFSGKFIKKHWLLGNGFSEQLVPYESITNSTEECKRFNPFLDLQRGYITIGYKGLNYRLKYKK